MTNQLTIQQVVQLAEQLQTENHFTDFIDSTLSRLEQIFHADSSVILNWTDFNWGGRPISKQDMFFHNYGNSNDWNYPEIHHQDPLYDWIKSGRCQRDLNVTRLSDLCHFNDIKRTRFYTELLLPMNCRYVLTMAVHHEGQILASISVTRRPEQNNFSRGEVQLAQMVTPILANALAHILLKSKSDLRDDIFSIVTNKYQQQALIIFSEDMQSVYRTERMTRLGERLQQYGNSIKDIFNKSADIEKYIRLFTSANTGKQRRLPKQLGDTVLINDKLKVSIILELAKPRTGRIYLIVGLRLLSQQENISELQLEYNLSFREFQVYQLAILGLSSTDIGKELAISGWSVKNHLKNIYRKTGVNTRVGLKGLGINMGAEYSLINYYNSLPTNTNKDVSTDLSH